MIQDNMLKKLRLELKEWHSFVANQVYIFLDLVYRSIVRLENRKINAYILCAKSTIFAAAAD